MMVVVKYTLKRFLRLKYQPAVILDYTVEDEMTSPTALYGHCMCGAVFEMYLVRYFEHRVVNGTEAWQALSALLLKLPWMWAHVMN